MAFDHPTWQDTPFIKILPQPAPMEKAREEALDTKHQIRSLLERPKELAERVLQNFDNIDGDKNGFIGPNDFMVGLAGMPGLKPQDRALVPILEVAYKHGGFDGSAYPSGITRRDLQSFALVQDPNAVHERIEHDAANIGMISGFGVSMATSIYGLTQIARGRARSFGLLFGLITIPGLGLVGKGVGEGLARQSLTASYAEETRHSKDLLDWLKRELT